VEVEWVPVDALDQYAPNYVKTPRPPGLSASPPGSSTSTGRKALTALGAAAAAGVAFGVKRWVDRHRTSRRQTGHTSAEQAADSRVTDTESTRREA